MVGVCLCKLALYSYLHLSFILLTNLFRRQIRETLQWYFQEDTQAGDSQASDTPPSPSDSTSTEELSLEENSDSSHESINEPEDAADSVETDESQVQTLGPMGEEET